MTTIASLPKDLVVSILRHCDEPTRDQTSTVSREFLECTCRARRDDYTNLATRLNGRANESLPTCIELGMRRCVKPNYGAILNIVVGCDAIANQKTSALHKFYRRAAALQQAEREGCSATWAVMGGVYLGGGTSGTPEGFGFWWSDLGRYEGEWRNGKYNGRGVLTWSDGTRYEGNFKDNKFHGVGIRVSSCGIILSGEFRENELDGWGILEKPSGFRYIGEWVRGKRHGLGSCLWASGVRYEGEWSEDIICGRGVCQYSGSSFYRGEWRANVPHGWGGSIKANGSIYEGQWCEGVWHGWGVYTSPDGTEKKQGKWKNRVFEDFSDRNCQDWISQASYAMDEALKMKRMVCKKVREHSEEAPILRTKRVL